MPYLFFFFFYVGLYVWVWVWACVCQGGHKEVREQLQVPALTFHCYLLSLTTKYARLTILWTSRGSLYLPLLYRAQDYSAYYVIWIYKHLAYRTISQALKEHNSQYSSFCPVGHGLCEGLGYPLFPFTDAATEHVWGPVINHSHIYSLTH